jgi:hypothetical protein
MLCPLQVGSRLTCLTRASSGRPWRSRMQRSTASARGQQKSLRPTQRCRPQSSNRCVDLPCRFSILSNLQATCTKPKAMPSSCGCCSLQAVRQALEEAVLNRPPAPAAPAAGALANGASPAAFHAPDQAAAPPARNLELVFVHECRCTVFHLPSVAAHVHETQGPAPGPGHENGLPW